MGLVLSCGLIASPIDGSRSIPSGSTCSASSLRVLGQLVGEGAVPLGTVGSQTVDAGMIENGPLDRR